MSSPLGETPPPGQYGDDLSGTVIACAVVSLVVAAFAVGARFYTRTAIVRAFGAEDWFVLAAWLLSVGNTAGTILQAKTAIGRHVWTLSPEDFVNYGKASWMTVLFYQLSLACCKISIILLYIRVLTYNYARRAAYLLLAIVVIYNVLGFISTMTLCIPLQKLWDPTIPGSCHGGPVYMWLAIGFHIGTDFLIFLLPMPVVIRMMVPRGQKIMLLFIFALGFFVCLISVLRAVWIDALLTSADFTWDFVAVTNWNSVEVNISIVCACLLVTKPLFTKFWRKVYPKPVESRTKESSGSERPATIGTETVYTPSWDPAFTRANENMGSEHALIADQDGIPMGDVESQYAAAVREVARPAKAYDTGR